jgi:hypothetical protein
MAAVEWKYDCANCDYVDKCKVELFKQELIADGNKFYALSEDFVSDMVIIINNECGRY